MPEKIINSMLECYEIDDFFRSILESNIKKNPGLVVDYMLDFTMAGSVSYIRADKLKFILTSFIKINKDSDGLHFDSCKMNQTIARLNYYINFLDYKIA